MSESHSLTMANALILKGEYAMARVWLHAALVQANATKQRRMAGFIMVAIQATKRAEHA